MSKAREEKYAILYAAIESFNDSLDAKRSVEFKCVVEMFMEYAKQIATDNQVVVDEIKLTVNELLTQMEKAGIRVDKKL